MRHSVECLRHIHETDCCLLASINAATPMIHGKSECVFCGMTTPKANCFCSGGPLNHSKSRSNFFLFSSFSREVVHENSMLLILFIIYEYAYPGAWMYMFTCKIDPHHRCSKRAHFSAARLPYAWGVPVLLAKWLVSLTSDREVPGSIPTGSRFFGAITRGTGYSWPGMSRES